MFPTVEPSVVPVNSYLNYALSLTQSEIEFIRDFSQWLPEEIIDSHTHSSTRGQCSFLDVSFLSRVSSTFPWFELGKHMKVNITFYPRKKVTMLVFPNAHRGINHRAANDYILRHAAKNPSIVPILYGLPDDVEYTISRLKTRRFCGLKMYPAYFLPPAQRIGEYYPEEVLKYCEKAGYPIILHLPSPLEGECLEELIRILEKFPVLKIVLAHMGLVFFPTQHFGETLSVLSKYENIYFDTAMATLTEVFEIVLDILGHHRIIFGTDQPFNLIRGRRVHHIPDIAVINPRIGRIATEYPYHWVDPVEQNEYSLYAKNAIHIHWEMLLSLRTAIKNYGESEETKSCIFYKNAEKLFQL